MSGSIILDSVSYSDWSLFSIDLYSLPIDPHPLPIVSHLLLTVCNGHKSENWYNEALRYQEHVKVLNICICKETWGFMKQIKLQFEGTNWMLQSSSLLLAMSSKAKIEMDKYRTSRKYLLTVYSSNWHCYFYFTTVSSNNILSYSPEWLKNSTSLHKTVHSAMKKTLLWCHIRPACSTTMSDEFMSSSNCSDII